MNIHVWFKDYDNDRCFNIFSLESSCDPFKVGDEICLSVRSLSNNDLSIFNKDMQDELYEKERDIVHILNNSTIKLIEKDIYVKFDALKNSVIEIEYFCEIV